MEVESGDDRTVSPALPIDWQLVSLARTSEIRSGIAKNASRSANNPVLVHYLRVANVQDGFLDLSEMSQICVSRDDITRYAVLPGDMLMNEGGDLDQLGRGTIWEGQYQPCIHQNHVFVVRCGRKLLPNYLRAWTGGAAARRYFMTAGKQTTNLASINKTALGLLPVALPPLAEQHNIADVLSNVDALIESLKQLLAKKRQIKHGAMQDLLTGGRRLPGHAAEWMQKPLGQVGEIVMGQSPASAHYNTRGDGLPLIQGNADISNRQTIKRVFTTEVTKLGRAGDILMSVRAPVGQVSRAVFDVCLGRGVCAIRYPNDFLYYALIAQERSWSGLSKGSTFDSVNSTDVKAFVISLPKLESEQTAIAAALSDMDAEIDALEAKLAKAQDIKQGMTQELLTGRIRLSTSKERRNDAR